MSKRVTQSDFFFPFEIGLVIFSISIGLTVLATGALPKWLGWVAIVVGVAALTPVGFFGFFVIMIWSVIVSILVFRRSGAPAAAAAAA